MDITEHFRSLDLELKAKKSRVRNFIADDHWLTDGEWKESVLRSMLGAHLPDSVKIGRGFVITPNSPSTQCDILLYRADVPVLFRDGDLVFVPPDAVIGIIEVKSSLNLTSYRDAIIKLASISDLLGIHRRRCFLGLFSYEWCGNQNAEVLLGPLVTACNSKNKLIELVCAGSSKFVRWWPNSPESQNNYQQWHAYELHKISAGYFIANVLQATNLSGIGRSERLWFPDNSKEIQLIGSRAHAVGCKWSNFSNLAPRGFSVASRAATARNTL